MGERATANLTRSGQDVRHRTTDTRLSFFLSQPPTRVPPEDQFLNSIDTCRH